VVVTLMMTMMAILKRLLLRITVICIHERALDFCSVGLGHQDISSIPLS
jgi:hypothetical protein